MSAQGSQRRIHPVMELDERPQRSAVDAASSAVAVSRALAELSETDLLRLQALARLRGRGLPSGVGWADLLHEALARALDGSRQWPSGVPLLAFLAGVMRSVCNELWRRRGREGELVSLDEFGRSEGPQAVCPAPDPERVLAACEAIAAIYRLFAGDGIALRIISGLEGGLSAEDIRSAHSLSAQEYDSARRRMRRALHRVGSGRDMR